MLKLKNPSPKFKLIALAVLSPLILTACSVSDLPVIGKFFAKKDSANVATPVELTMWGLWEPKDLIGSVNNEYKKEKPNVSINYEERSVVGSLKNYKDSVFTRLSEGTAPDIIVVHNTWVPFLRDNLAPAPDGVVNAEAFYPVAKAWGSSADQKSVYAVPLSYDGLALVYNRDMFTEANLSAPPTSWEEFRQMAVALTKRDKDGVISQAGAAIGTANNIEHFSDILGLFFSQASVKVPDDLNSKAAADALTFYTNFATQEKVWSDVLPQSVEAFADRKVAMAFVPSWEVLNILARNPQINMGVASVPKALDLEGRAIDVNWGSFWMVAVSKSSKNPAVAWDYLRFLTTEDTQRKLFSEGSKVRAFGQPYALKSLQSELSGNAYLDTYLRSGDTAKSGVFASRAGNDKEVDALKTAVNSVIAGEAAEKALITTQDVIK